MKILLAGLASLLVIYVLTQRLERASIFFPSREIETTPAWIGLSYEDVNLQTSDGLKLHAWYVRTPLERRGVVLFFHGNAGNISHRLEKIAFFSRLGLDTFIIDYRGYGQSEGRPGEKGLYEDGEAAYQYLTGTRGLSADEILAFGESLGGVVAIQLASRRPVRGLITVNTFTSVKEMSREHYPFIPTFFIRTRLDAFSKIKDVPCPKLVMHSRDDDIVPFRLGEKLFRQAGEPKRFVEMHGHHNEAFFESMDIAEKSIFDFLVSLGLSTRR